MKNLAVICGMVLLVSSCNYLDKPKKPKRLLTKAEMSHILLDMSLINSAKGLHQKVLDENGIFSEKYVYKKYAIDSLTFAENNNYYAYDFDAYAEIYTMVEDSLGKLSELYVKKEEEEKEAIRVQDSLSKIESDSIRQTKGRKEILREKFDVNKIKSVTYPKKTE